MNSAAALPRARVLALSQSKGPRPGRLRDRSCDRPAEAPARRTLEALAQVVRELEGVATHSRQEYHDGLYVRRSAERLIQLAVDHACVLALHALDGAGGRTPGGYAETFAALARAGVVEEAMAEKLGAAAALRQELLYGWPPPPDDDVHRRLPYLAVLFAEYGKRMEARA